ncbi:MAG TPA: ABC-ATPase domain-containing protein, partial [Allocoleopsis sp.]
VEARFVVGLPAQGRSILGRQAAELLCDVLPEVVARSLYYKALSAKAIQQHVETIEDADWLRQQLAPHNLVAFIPNGVVLPRRSGVDDRPLETGIPFQSPPSLQVEFDRPNQGKVIGMGIPKGVTLIVGGGYHGKSTLLQSISYGVYNHVPGDGREQVITDANAMKIRAEDGRSITAVNISPFINHLPQGRSTTHFSTPNASGSTSQAANIIEALEVGATVLLVDEDTSATNFMIRDRRMQALISKDKEPITPFVDKIRQLYSEYGVSTILVMGGSGDYFEVADTVIAMTEFEPEEVTDQAKLIAQTYSTHRQAEGGDRFGTITPRYPVLPAETGKLKVRDITELVLGNDAIDLSAVEQLVEVGQLRAIGAAMIELQQQQGTRSLRELVNQVLAQIQTKGLDTLSAYPTGDLVQFRSLELAAVMNRWRSIEVEKVDKLEYLPVQDQESLPGFQ